jgi:hypothetical protein
MHSPPIPPPPKPDAKPGDLLGEDERYRYVYLSETEIRVEDKPGTPVENERQLRAKLQAARAQILAKPSAARLPHERNQANLIALLLGDLDTPGI